MNEITQKLYGFIKPYLAMEVKGVVINCPYWMNQIRKGGIIRGLGNGKGDAEKIKKSLEEVFDGSDIYKLARRKRIGIDCSGFVYRALTSLIPNLDDFFPGGINKTNAAKLTKNTDSVLIKNVDDIRAGDLIRMRGGKHIAIVVEKDRKKIIYAHSSSRRYTIVSGVHLGKIEIINSLLSLEKQIWTEKLKDGSIFQKTYFRPEKGDGVFRLKWMNS